MEMTFDSIITDSSFTVLPEGDYPYYVESFTKVRHEGKPGSKIGSCWAAELQLSVGDAEQSTQIKHKLFLHQTTIGFIAEFGVSAGLRKHGDQTAFPWNNVPGSSGWCHVVVEDYTGKDGQPKQINKIKKFLPPRQVQTEFQKSVTSEPQPF